MRSITYPVPRSSSYSKAKIRCVGDLAVVVHHVHGPETGSKLPPHRPPSDGAAHTRLSPRSPDQPGCGLHQRAPISWLRKHFK